MPPTHEDVTTIKDILGKRGDHYSEAFRSDDLDAFAGIPTGFPELDKMLGGLDGGDLMILAARPSMGKTALALNIASNVVANEGKSVGVFSLEMTKEQIVDRMVASKLGVDTHSLIRGTITDEQYGRLGGVMDSLTQLPIHIDDSPDVTLAGPGSVLPVIIAG